LTTYIVFGFLGKKSRSQTSLTNLRHAVMLSNMTILNKHS